MRNELKRRPLRTAIVGCGRMGQQHARSVAALGHTVSIVCDVDAARANGLSAQHPGCRAVTAPETISWDTVDAAFICTPPFARGPVEIAAASAGVALFLEKPIGLASSTGRAMLAAVRDSGVVSSVGYMNRYRSSVSRAREVLQAHAPLGFTANWVGAAYKVPWWGDPSLSGGQINEQCTHVIDLARYLVGEVTQVDAFSQPSPDGRGDASVAMLLRFDRGMLGTITCGCLAEEKQIGARIFTRTGQLALDGWDFKGSASGAHRDVFEGPGQDDVFVDECAAFLNAVAMRDRSGIRSDLEDALKTQEVVDAVVASLAARRAERSTGNRTEKESNHALISA
ncbi:MAG: Gfo/Idh/MocA family protein [Myxococcaceae bacterium]